MGRGSSKVGGSSGAGGGVVADTAHNTYIGNKLRDISIVTSDPFDAISKVADVLNNDARVGTTLVLNGTGNIMHQYVKRNDGKWEVTTGKSIMDLKNNKPSIDSVNMTAGEIVNDLYKLS